MVQPPRKSKKPLRLHGIQPGDILGFAACDPLGVAIRACTCRWSCCGGINHVGIVTWWPWGQLTDSPTSKRRFPLVLCESTAHPPGPCLVQRHFLKGVQVHRIRTRVLAYPGRVYCWPLAKRLTFDQQSQLQSRCESRLGTAYDWTAALHQRHTPLAWLIRRFRGEDLKKMDCSEFVASCHEALGVMPVDNASRFSPNRLIRHGRRLGILGKPRRVK